MPLSADSEQAKAGSMGEPSDKSSTCMIKAYIRAWFAVTSEIRGDSVRRSMTMKGFIDDYHGEDGWDPSPDKRYHGQGIKLFLSAPHDEAWAAGLCKKEGLSCVCGVAHIEANVIPKTYEWDGETIEDEPVQICFSLSHEAFNAIQQQAYGAERRGHLLTMRAALCGSSLPDGGKLGLVSLRNLDLSESREFAVSSVSFMETKTADRLRGRVLPIEPARDERYVASLRVLLTEVRYDLDVARNEIRSISCEGRVLGTRKPYDGADVTVEFREHLPSRVTDELPKRAFAGEFSYHPKRPEEEYSSTFFSFGLNYIAEDARELLLPILAYSAATEIVLLTDLVSERDALAAATEPLKGEVRNYRFEVRRRFIEDRSD